MVLVSEACMAVLIAWGEAGVKKPLTIRGL